MCLLSSQTALWPEELGTPQNNLEPHECHKGQLGGRPWVLHFREHRMHKYIWHQDPRGQEAVVVFKAWSMFGAQIKHSHFSRCQSPHGKQNWGHSEASAKASGESESEAGLAGRPVPQTNTKENIKTLMGGWRMGWSSFPPFFFHPQKLLNNWMKGVLEM